VLLSPLFLEDAFDEVGAIQSSYTRPRSEMVGACCFGRVSIRPDFVGTLWFFSQRDPFGTLPRERTNKETISVVTNWILVNGENRLVDHNTTLRWNPASVQNHILIRVIRQKYSIM
jgi:hypothetical protein